MKNKTNEFIKKAKKIHKNKYDYNLAIYRRSNIKIKIVCPFHGVFKQTPNDHLSGRGCRECKKKTLSELKTSNLKEFIQKAKKIHGEKYDYSNSCYSGSHNKITIICPSHGDFSQIATDHLSGKGCKECGILKAAEQRRLTTKEFIDRAKKIHGNKYIYDKSLYETMHKKVTITCSKHGDFYQTPLNHIFDNNGCPLCKKSKGEMRIKKYLELTKIIFQPQYRIKECRNKKPLPFDFMIEFKSQKYLIEFQGQQHFQECSGSWKKTRNEFKNIKKRDKIKKEWCEKNKIPLLIITYKEYDCIEKKISDFLGLST